ncbi:MAG: LysR family transcriptional regulator [Saccharospirillaceae bacterium]|nr:LysR family transcriptional regulator [Pseudomonadales bacterium]NRB78904.1 LysR family transcriptional regulator [Saccharospirillaceae bacterium]
MDKWSEIRTAYQLAKLKTLSATAQQMGVHRSTVMRHIDVLEAHLGVVLFQRNDKGYIATEAGLEVMRLGEITQVQFNQLAHQLRNQDQELSGVLTITCMSAIASILMPAIKQYQKLNPLMQVEIKGDERNFDLEYGEADIAFRAGAKPQTLDNIVKVLYQDNMVLSVHQSYIDAFGEPNKNNLQQQRFIAIAQRPKHLLWNEWLYENFTDSQIVLKGNDPHILKQGLMAGIGLGFTPLQFIKNQPDVFEVDIDKKWDVSIWMLIHRDMNKMVKIKAFLKVLKQTELNSFDW